MLKNNFEKISIGNFILIYFLANFFFSRTWVFSILVFLLIYIKSLEDWERKITFNIPKDSMKLSAVYIFIPALITLSITILQDYLFINFAPEIFRGLYNRKISLGEVYQTFSTLRFILIVIDAALLVPIVDEILFRRILYPLFCINNKPLLAMLYTSLIFMFFFPSVGIHTFFLSMLLTLIYQVTGNIKYPIFAHMIHNLMTLVLSIIASQDNRLVQNLELILGISLILAVASLIWLYKDRKLFADYLKKDNPIERITVEGLAID